MKISRIFLLITLYTIFCWLPSYSEINTGVVKGRVIEENSRIPVPFANIIVQGTDNGTATDIDGNFTLRNVNPGYIKLVVSSIGYITKVTEDIFVTNEKSPYIEIILQKSASNISEVVITTPQFVKKDESPVSLQTIGIREIERNPGGNRDISKVIQSLPGVASTPSFRNDIIIRGGSPSENKFYLDGIEVPVINHFQTQGSTGGPVGIINVNFIREVDFYSGAFPVNRGNTLSSILEFRQIEGNQEKLGLRGTIGSSDIGLTADGPLGSKTNFIFSIRRSYLQFLFAALKLPFLPTFTDAQFKVKHKINEKNEITFLGLGAYDDFELNKKANDGITDPETLERNNYILGNIPTYNQWNYATGLVYRHYGEKNTQTLVASRNQLNNQSKKYINNDDSSNNNLLNKYASTETENKIRFENAFAKGTLKITAGLNLETAEYTVLGFDNITTSSGAISRKFDSSLNIFKYGIFGSVSKPVIKNKLLLSFGIRTDANTYSGSMNNPAEQLSPRFSASYSLNEKWSLNFNTGRYYQLPAYTILGYGIPGKSLVNKQNNIKYISSDHLVSGIQFNPESTMKFTVEGFYKKYNNYPFSLTDSISLANLGSDFGVIGNDLVNSSSKGRSYGIEFLAQRRSPKGIYGIIAYTYVRSEFQNRNATYIPSSWDNQHLVTITTGTKFGKNWDAGLKWRYVGGRPYTPYDIAASSLKSNWDAKHQGIPDYSKLNSLRLKAFHQLDIRIDKTWFLKKWSLNLYLDIQNLYNFKAESQDILNVRTDINGNPITDSSDPDRYEIYFIKDDSGTVLPALGVIIDF